MKEVEQFCGHQDSSPYEVFGREVRAIFIITSYFSNGEKHKGIGTLCPLFACSSQFYAIITPQPYITGPFISG